MRLEKVSITNFKSLKQSELVPTSFACLVGENNTGKSSALQAIVYGLNRPTTLPQSLFYDLSIPVKIELAFSDIVPRDLLRLKEEHRSKIEPLIFDGRLEIQVTYEQDERCGVTVSKRLPKDPKYFPENIAELLKGKQGKAVHDAVEEAFPEFVEDLPEQINITQAKEFLSKKIAVLPESNFEFKPGPLPSGIKPSIFLSTSRTYIYSCSKKSFGRFEGQLNRRHSAACLAFCWKTLRRI